MVQGTSAPLLAYEPVSQGASVVLIGSAFLKIFSGRNEIVLQQSVSVVTEKDLVSGKVITVMGKNLNSVLHPELLRACVHTLNMMDIRQHSLQSI